MIKALKYGLVLKKVHRLVKFNQKSWLKSYNDLNTKLRKNAKNDFEEDFFKLMNNAVFEKTIENVRKHRCMKLLTTETRINYLLSEPDNHVINIFYENWLAIEMKRKQILMKKTCLVKYITIRNQ